VLAVARGGSNGGAASDSVADVNKIPATTLAPGHARASTSIANRSVFDSGIDVIILAIYAYLISGNENVARDGIISGTNTDQGGCPTTELLLSCFDV
jgi:hypothetical protein